MFLKGWGAPMSADMIKRRFDPCEDGYLYLDKRRLVPFTTEERDAYVAAYEKASAPGLALIVPVLIVGAAIGAALFFGLSLPGWAIMGLVFASSAMIENPSRKVQERLAKDAAARPSIDRRLSQAELEARQVNMLSWSLIFSMLCSVGWILFNCLTHPSAVNWIFAAVAGFMGLVFLSIAARKAFGGPVVGPKAPVEQ
jgi:hypothetical protein